MRSVAHRKGLLRTGSLLAAVLVAAVAAACTFPFPPGGGPETTGGGLLGTGNGYAGTGFRERQDDYLRFATEVLSPPSAANVLAHLARDRRDPRFHFDARAVKPADFAASFAKIDSFQDTSDFDMMRLMALWWGYRDRLDPRFAARSSSASSASATGTPTRRRWGSSTRSGSGPRTTA